MKLFNLAVASIVDANTGNGVNRRFIEEFASASSDYEIRGREIRAKSILSVIGKIKASFKRYIGDLKARAQEQRDIKAILGLSDHHLQDIGLTHVDRHDLRWGQTTLEGLNARRELNRIQEMGQLLSQSSSSVGGKVRSIKSANQVKYESRKYA